MLETNELDEEASSILDDLALEFNLADELTFRRSEKYAISGNSFSHLAYLLGSAMLSVSEIASLATRRPGRNPAGSLRGSCA